MRSGVCFRITQLTGGGGTGYRLNRIGHVLIILETR